MASINEFRANFKGLGARPNRFRIEMTFPALVANGALAGRSLRILGKGASLPNSTLGSVPVFYMGRTGNLPGDRTFDPWTITVYNDEDFLIKNAFESWSNLINSHRGNMALAPLPNLMVNPTITQLGKNDQPIKTYRFYNMWPMEVSSIDLASEANDSVEEFSVTFHYDEWESDTTPS